MQVQPLLGSIRSFVWKRTLNLAVLDLNLGEVHFLLPPDEDGQAGKAEKQQAGSPQEGQEVKAM